jgi:hypothetical protein
MVDFEDFKQNNNLHKMTEVPSFLAVQANLEKMAFFTFMHVSDSNKYQMDSFISKWAHNKDLNPVDYAVKGFLNDYA